MGAAIALAPPPVGALGLAVQIVVGALIYGVAILALVPRDAPLHARAPSQFVRRLRSRGAIAKHLAVLGAMR